MRKGFGGMPSGIKQEYLTDPRLAMARQLAAQGMSVAPVQSPLEGLARALQGGLAGYQEGRIADEYKGRSDAYANTIADALGQKGGSEETIAALSSNPDTADLALQLKMKHLDPTASGGATGVLVKQYMDSTGATFPEALQAVQSGFRQNMLLQNGQLMAIPGAPEAKGALKAGEVAGQKGVELQFDPMIAGAREGAQLEQQLRLKPEIEAATKKAESDTTANTADNQATPIIEQLRQFNKKAFEMPYSESTSNLLRVIPNDSIQQKVTNTDLLRQARLDLAAPLAKQLGVNPTDKDFQASLDRIFDLNATQESRAAQIEALDKRIKMRQASRKPAMTQEQATGLMDVFGEAPAPQAAPAPAAAPTNRPPLSQFMK